jgi:hypothetical protein
MAQKKSQAAAQNAKTRTAISKRITGKSPQLRSAVREKLASSQTLRKLKPQQRKKLSLALANFCKVSSQVLHEQAGQKKVLRRRVLSQALLLQSRRSWKFSSPA